MFDQEKYLFCGLCVLFSKSLKRQILERSFCDNPCTNLEYCVFRYLIVSRTHILERDKQKKKHWREREFFFSFSFFFQPCMQLSVHTTLMLLSVLIIICFVSFITLLFVLSPLQSSSSSTFSLHVLGNLLLNHMDSW